MRNITAYRRSTPTYVYNISGADVSGIDLDTMSIGMTIKWDDYTVYILPESGTYNMFGIVESATVKVLRSPYYSSHDLNTNSFKLSLPLWKLPSSLGDEATYQIFLFRSTPFSTVRYNEETETLTLGTMPATNIVIDAGAFMFIDSLVPPIVGQEGPAVPSRDDPPAPTSTSISTF